jgi:hypothetical protein
MNGADASQRRLPRESGVQRQRPERKRLGRRQHRFDAHLEDIKAHSFHYEAVLVENATLAFHGPDASMSFMPSFTNMITRSLLTNCVGNSKP